MTCIYRDPDHAVMCAISIGSVGIPKSANWQKDHGSGFVESLTSRNRETMILTREEKLAQAAMTASRIHRETSEIQWCAFLAKYSQCEKERTKAIKSLATYVESVMPEKFKLLAVWSWACLSIRRGLREQILLLDSDKSRRTLFRHRKKIYEQLRNLEWSALAALGMPLEENGLFEDDGDE